MFKIISVIFAASISMTTPFVWACQQPVCTSHTVCDDSGAHLGAPRCHEEESCTSGTCGSFEESVTTGTAEKASESMPSEGVSAEAILENLTPAQQDQKCWVQLGECDEGVENHGCWVSTGHYGALACSCCAPADHSQGPSQQ